MRAVGLAEGGAFNDVVTGVGVAALSETGIEAVDGPYEVSVTWTEGATEGELDNLECTVTGVAGTSTEGKTITITPLDAWTNEIDTGCGFKIMLGETPGSTTDAITVNFTSGAVVSPTKAQLHTSKIDDAIATVSDSIAKIGASVSR